MVKSNEIRNNNNFKKLNSYQNVHVDMVDVEMDSISTLDNTSSIVVNNNSLIIRKRVIIWPLAVALFVAAYLMSCSRGLSSSNTATTATVRASGNILGSSSNTYVESAATAKATGGGGRLSSKPSSGDMPDRNDPNGRYDWQKCLNADDDGCWKQEGERVGSFWQDFGQRMKTFWKSVGDWFKLSVGKKTASPDDNAPPVVTAAKRHHNKTKTI